ncbi:MAG: GNAT family N-acetyltransferase [Candidatus Poribacteria bacterium]|nr:GNAT family N-acetyltransferase [Candidatus Poribacteria bacterium]
MRIERLVENDRVWKISLSIEGEADVSRLWIFAYEMRFGSALLRMGGIGGVGTNDEHRNQGFARHVMEDSTALMAEQGFDVAMLFGIRDFYPKFGYATTLPEVRVALNTADAREAVSSYRIRKFEMHDAPQVLALYAANNAERTGTVVRYADWQGFKMGSSFSEEAAAFVVLDETDGVIGYFVCDDTDKHCTLSDIGFQDRTVFDTIVHFLTDRADRIGAERIECSMPPDHPFAIFCRRYGCQTSIRDPKNGGGMMRIINQSSTLKKITDELERRLQRSAHFSQWAGRILITTELGRDCLGIDRGRVAHLASAANAYRLEMPQDKLIQLMMGRRGIEDLAVDSDVSVTGGIIPVLDTLFPVGYPHVWWPDRF